MTQKSLLGDTGPSMVHSFSIYSELLSWLVRVLGAGNTAVSKKGTAPGLVEETFCEGGFSGGRVGLHCKI